ncbi:helix-turn-helix domain-containing protein [Streptomyces sp. NPDC006668]|uniref:helix-turn-helix domain-containing protein n=1 Tax=Streptomyces sp. NPDC006668 TaxID=3156903 RepID=UPI0033CEDE03
MVLRARPEPWRGRASGDPPPGGRQEGAEGCGGAVPDGGAELGRVAGFPQIADELRCSQKTVRRWLHRFNRCGLEGLEDLGGQGRKQRITEAERSRIVGLVSTPAVDRDLAGGGDPRTVRGRSPVLRHFR